MGNLASCLASRRSGGGRGALSITIYIPTFTQILCQRPKVLYFTLPYLHLLKINLGGCCNITNAPKLISLTVLVEECYSVIDSQIIKSPISRWRPELAQLSRVGIEQGSSALHCTAQIFSENFSIASHDSVNRFVIVCTFSELFLPSYR